MVQLNFFRREKAQIESFGLVIIVILLVFIFVFFLYLRINSGNNSNTDQLLGIKANNLRNTILKTSLCRDTTIKDEIISCSTDGQGDCGSCDELKNNIKTIIGSSLEPNIDYNFIPYEIKKGDCREKITSTPQPITNDITVGIDLCFKSRIT
ncbi:hypothetical protein J4214_04580 [Candidatus Woesearchaeota archaeon]|nr:hypothetical protein [Candidatus Woesearchaeota archaeon]